MEKIEALLNNFASRCFRDVADRDYISARMCYRAGLISQFHWSALQAFEKYFKAILLYNRIKANNINHSLTEAQKALCRAPFSIRLSDSSKELLDHLDNYGRFRYLETSYFIHGPKLYELDKSVWELRRYCRPLDKGLLSSNFPITSTLELELRHNEFSEGRPPQEFRILGGELEIILADKNNPARAPLIWKNAFYSCSRRKQVTIPTHFYSENSPLFLYPELLDHVLEYVYLPKSVVEAYRTANQSTTKRKNPHQS